MGAGVDIVASRYDNRCLSGSALQSKGSHSLRDFRTNRSGFANPRTKIGIKEKPPMPTPTTYSRRSFFMPNPRSWIVFSLSILLIVGLPSDRVKGGPPPAVVLSATNWTPIGPAPAAAGSFTFSGRVDVAASDPSNSSVMYVGANNGGIWKTTDWLDPSPTW